jgi:prephenate dehydrogenase
LSIKLIHHLTIIGVGLIGGSVAKALRCQNAVGHVTGFGRRESTLQRAQALGVIDSWSLDLGAAVEQAEVVIISSPVNTIASIFHELKPYLGETTIVTDAGSVKGAIVDAAVRGLGDKIINFVPGHPIAGKEKSGVDAASETLFLWSSNYTHTDG